MLNYTWLYWVIGIHRKVQLKWEKKQYLSGHRETVNIGKATLVSNGDMIILCTKYDVMQHGTRVNGLISDKNKNKNKNIFISDLLQSIEKIILYLTS
jgi:hypothetical protein